MKDFPALSFRLLAGAGGGAALLLLCVIFEIHGSSIGVYADIFQHPELSDIILGKYRWGRSDEWLVFTPFAFSQYFNNFEMTSEIVRGTATNMFLTYGQAVWHLAMIYRPAQLGFLFLDAGSGLAFFWMGRLIILFLVSLEFARLILQLDKRLSLLYAIMVAFSPFVQWWFAVNSIAEILAAGQGLVIFFKLYLDNVKTSRRFLYGAGFLWCAGIFIFGIYPAWQVSFGYVFLVCIIAVAAENLNAAEIILHDKKFWLIGAAVMLLPILHVLYLSQDMIQIQMATEYPGRRFTNGGDFTFLRQMTHSIGAVLPYSTIDNGSANVGESTFYSMAPLGLIIFFYARKFDKFSCALLGLLIFFLIFELIGFPRFLAGITLMSNVPEFRLRPVIDFIQLLILFRSLKFLKKYPARSEILILAGLIGAASSFAIYNLFPEWTIRRELHMMIILAASIFLFLSPPTKKRTVILVLILLSMGLTVNPVNSGVDVIYKMPVGQKISEIVRADKKSLWICEGDLTRNDFPLMFGAPTINSVNVYPDLERWKKLDGGENFKIYNRYAHIEIEITKEPTNFKLVQDDVFRVNLNVEDLPALDAKYIFSRHNNLQDFSTAKIKIAKIYEDAGTFIYRIN